MNKKRKAKRSLTPPVLAAPSVEMSGRDGVRIEAHRGVSEFTPEEMTVRLINGSLVIKGDRLSIRAMNADFITVSGRIDSAVYIE